MPAPKKKTARKPPASRQVVVAAPEEARCHHEDAEGQRCPTAIAHPGTRYCRRHVEEHENAMTNEEKLQEELAALRAQNAVLQTQMKRLLAEPEPEPAPVGVPSEDPAVAAERMARGAEEPAYQRPAARRRTDIPAEAQATAYMLGMLQKAQDEAYAEREARRRDPRRRGQRVDEGRIPIEMRVEIPPQLDPSAIVDRKGNNLVPPGHVGRWLRTYRYDADGSRVQDDYHVAFHEQVWGAKPIKEPIYDEDNNPTGQTRNKKGMLGLAYAMPIEAYAKRIIHHSQHGSFDSVLDGEYGRLDDLMEAENRRYGKRGGAGQIVPVGGGDDRSDAERWFESEAPKTTSVWE